MCTGIIKSLLKFIQKEEVIMEHNVYSFETTQWLFSSIVAFLFSFFLVYVVCKISFIDPALFQVNEKISIPFLLLIAVLLALNGL